MALNGSWSAASVAGARTTEITPFPAPAWKEGRVRLPFNIGSLNLFAVEFRGFICSLPDDGSHFSSLPKLSDEAEVALVRRARLAEMPAEFRGKREHPELYRYLGPPVPRFCISLRGSFANYFAKFSPKTQSTLRRKLKRLNRDFGDDIACLEYRTPSEVAEFCEISRRVSIGRYASEILRNEVWPHREALIARARQDKTRCYALVASGNPIAYLYCAVEGTTVVHTISAYDPHHSSYSPGVLLQLASLEKLFGEHRFELFDFMTGSGQHKQFFATENLPIADVYYFRRTPRTLAIVAAHKAFRRVVAGCDRAFRALRLDPALRRLRRRIATTPPGVEFWREHAD